MLTLVIFVIVRDHPLKDYLIYQSFICRACICLSKNRGVNPKYLNQSLMKDFILIVLGVQYFTHKPLFHKFRHC